MSKIKNIIPRYILDSRGNPTIEVDIVLDNNIIGRASVPSGASTGKFEALELRDNSVEFHGKHVLRAIQNIKKTIKPALIGLNIRDISKIDSKMISIDGTDNKEKLGANAILGVSLACVKAGALSIQKPLFEYIQSLYPQIDNYIMPMPMMNILNGGAHADNDLDIQEFMICPTGFSSFSDSLRAGVEIFHSLKNNLQKRGLNTNIGDEGGFAPNINNTYEAIDLIIESIEQSGYTAGSQIQLALDVAASEFYNTNTQRYALTSHSQELSSEEMIQYYVDLCTKYPIISIEDPLYEDDWAAWTSLTAQLGNTTQIVGDDLTVTNYYRLKKAIDLNSINAILIKLNQIGTFTETMETILLAQKNKLGTIISHRSGETENTFIADLAVAINAGQIKTGSLCRSDRTAKYNQLLRIEEKQNISFAKSNYIKCKK